MPLQVSKKQELKTGNDQRGDISISKNSIYLLPKLQTPQGIWTRI